MRAHLIDKCFVFALLCVSAAIVCGCKEFIPVAGPSWPPSIYLGSSDKYVYALNSATGELRWKMLLGGEIHSTPLIVNGSVFVGTTDGMLYALSESIGKIQWKIQLVPANVAAQYGREIFTNPVHLPGTVFIASKYQGTIYACDQFTGILTNTHSLGSDTVQWLTAGNDLKTLYVNTDSKNYYVLGGWTQSQYAMAGPLIEGMVHSDFLLGYGGKFVYLFDPATGKELESPHQFCDPVQSMGTCRDQFYGQTICTFVGGVVSYECARPGIGQGPPSNCKIGATQATSWVNADLCHGIFFATVDGSVWSPGAETSPGSQSWLPAWGPKKLDTDFIGPPVLALVDQVGTYRVVVVSKSGHVYGLDPKDGTMVWPPVLNVIGGTVDAIPVAGVP